MLFDRRKRVWALFSCIPSYFLDFAAYMFDRCEIACSEADLAAGIVGYVVDYETI